MSVLSKTSSSGLLSRLISSRQTDVMMSSRSLLAVQRLSIGRRTTMGPFRAFSLGNTQVISEEEYQDAQARKKQNSHAPKSSGPINYTLGYPAIASIMDRGCTVLLSGYFAGAAILALQGVDVVSLVDEILVSSPTMAGASTFAVAYPILFHFSSFLQKAYNDVNPSNLTNYSAREWHARSRILTIVLLSALLAFFQYRVTKTTPQKAAVQAELNRVVALGHAMDAARSDPAVNALLDQIIAYQDDLRSDVAKLPEKKQQELMKLERQNKMLKFDNKEIVAKVEKVKNGFKELQAAVNKDGVIDRTAVEIYKNPGWFPERRSTMLLYCMIPGAFFEEFPLLNTWDEKDFKLTKKGEAALHQAATSTNSGTASHAAHH